MPITTPGRHQNVSDTEDRKNARAEAAAEKARAKAMRPWYKRKRFIIPIALVALIAIISIAGGGASEDDTSDDRASESSSNENDGVTSKLSSNSDNKPADDVEVTACELQFGVAKASLEITNHSSKRSNYLIELTFERDGVKVGDGVAAVNNVEPDQKAESEGIGTASGDGAIECRLVNVERYAS
jgi:hypothetical protein